MSRYENGVWKVLPPQDFARDVVGLFQRLRAPFSSGKVASVVDTLKLIIPQQEAPSRRLIGFRNGVLDTQNGTFHPHSPSHWMRTLCDVDFTPPVDGETLETHAPAFWRWLDRAAGGRAEKRDVILYRTVYGAGKPLRLAALSGGDRSRRQRQKYHGGNSHPAGTGEDNATSVPPLRRWNPRVNVPR
ncbi:hypothetical protein FTV91_02700 [Escherichia coli]|nr:hypothetical protein FTV91_02700 [Escherichia coli]